MLVEGSAAEEVQGVGSTLVRIASGTSAQCVAGSLRVGNVLGMVVQWPELANGTPVTPAMRHGGLTPSDSALCGGVVGI